jgi:hypothetical protein
MAMAFAFYCGEISFRLWDVENSAGEATMKKMIGRLKPFDERTGYLTVVIETPTGSRVKIAHRRKKGGARA